MNRDHKHPLDYTVFPDDSALGMDILGIGVMDASMEGETRCWTREVCLS